MLHMAMWKCKNTNIMHIIKLCIHSWIFNDTLTIMYCHIFIIKKLKLWKEVGMVVQKYTYKDVSWDDKHCK